MFFSLRKFIKKYVYRYMMYNNVERLLAVTIKSTHLLNLALTSNTDIVSKRIAGETELILSFTTYNKRVHDVHLVIESIAEQTLKPNRLILWLDENEFTLETIPLILHKQIERGLEVRFCPNYKSYKKLIPTLMQFPNANIITIDDDVLYPHDMIEILYKENKLFPNCILSHMAHKIVLDLEGYPLPYLKWEIGTAEHKEGKLIVPIGVGGVFYPVGALSHECLNNKKFTALAPHADDIWFKAMSLLNDIKCKKVNDARDFSERFLILQNNQDIGLMHENFFKGRNDEQIKNVFEQYNIKSYLGFN